MSSEQNEAFRREVQHYIECSDNGLSRVPRQFLVTILEALAASQPAPAPAADIHKRFDELVERSGGAVDPRQRDHYKRLLADAEARQRGENLDGSPRRECVPAPAADTGQAVAYRVRMKSPFGGTWLLRHVLPEWENWDIVIPLYTHPAPLDAERVREAALLLSCEDQFAVASYLSANLGYEMQPEPLHPDTPEPGAFEHSAEAHLLRQEERVREDERDRLMSEAVFPLEFGPGAINKEVWMWLKRFAGAMDPVDRAALRQKEGK